jgi:GTP-binding protein
MTRDDDGTLMEPVEEVVIDVDDEHAGTVIQTLSQRRADLVEMAPSGAGRTRVILHAPTRGLIGYQGELLSDTRGTGIMNRVFHAYVPHKGAIPVRHTGVLIANGDGEAAAYALWNLEERGPMFIDPGVKVYRGMIVGEHTRGTDLEVNVTKGKQLSNVRASGKDDAVKLTPPVRLSLERALSYISDAELVEVTPKSIRLRKVHLDPHERKKAERAREEV